MLANVFIASTTTTMIARVTISPEASAVVAQLKVKFGDLMFHQSGGCCDGSQPMCFEKGDFILGQSDVCLGTIDGCEFWMSKDQFEYWQNTQLNIHITAGRGSSFSLEIPMGLRFLTRSRLFLDAEIADLAPVRFIEVLLGRNALVVFKSTDKIIAVVKSCFK
jgi:uncharacterized protein